MKRSLGIVLAIVVLSLSMNGFMTGVIAQDATPATEAVATEATPASADNCEGVTEYARVLLMLASGIAAASYGLPSTQISEWTDTAYEALIGALTKAVEELTGVTAPEAAKKLNDYAIVAIKTVQGAVVFIRTSGLGSSLPFVDQLDKVDDVLTQIISTLQESCPDSNIATPVASPAAA